MKRRSFMLSGAGAALAGCAGQALSPNSLIDSAVRPTERKPAYDHVPLIGSVILLPYAHFLVPKYFARCDGQFLRVEEYPLLFAVLGYKFGRGTGSSSFGLPDFRGDLPVKLLDFVIGIDGYFQKPGGREPNDAPLMLLGQLMLVAYRPEYMPPPGWARCDGALLKIRDHSMLYSLIGNTFGGDGRTTFAVPDTRQHELRGIAYVIALRGSYPHQF